MRTTITMMLLACVIFLASSCASTSQSVTMRDLGPGLAKYENNTKINILKKENVSYSSVGMPKYDRFFKESAIFYGKVKVADSLIANGKKNEARRMLIPMAAEGKRLYSQGQGLIGSAQADFAGPNAVKIPQVVIGLKSATGNIKNSIQTIPELLKKAK